MELYIQMGHGTQQLSIDLIKKFSGGSIILSPMNIKPGKIETFAKSAKNFNGKIVIDPQLYYPRKHQKNLQLYDYWPNENITYMQNGNYDTVIEKLHVLNEMASTDFFILPTEIINKFDARWNTIQNKIIDFGRKYGNKKIYHTLALGSNILNDESAVESIIQCVEKWDVEGVYIVCEHPPMTNKNTKSEYLVENPNWVANLMNLVAGIKLSNKKVIVGYANHQLLCLSLAKCDAIASGSFLNLRWFQSKHFETLISGGGQRSLWYYAPQVLSEYKVIFLDIAKRLNVLELLKPSEKMMNEYCQVLFNGNIPSVTNYKESDSHRHYLYCLKKQCDGLTCDSYNNTKAVYLNLINTAEQIQDGLHANEITGQNRDFADFSTVNRAAIAVFEQAYGNSMRMEWDNL
ncbi:hypothetical protein [Propionispira raffinosivorans]|uniref:hypothetical protein n=1 Tax=Propionispira raffinosivorans TaxID=86959 RepID=UPI00036EE65E|nr:hypothetical protein [Propionispira raffinosivorans]